jgi:hypothetical protein
MIVYSSASAQNGRISKYLIKGDERGLIQLIVTYQSKINYEINYAYNGWQVLDSVRYIYHDDSIIQLSHFRAKYDENYTKIVDHELYKVESVSLNCYYCMSTLGFHDRYLVLKSYLKIWEQIFEIEQHKYGVGFGMHAIVFENKVIVSRFMQYGLQYNESLDSCSFTIDENYRLSSDRFIFESSRVERTFVYDDINLIEVRLDVSTDNGATSRRYIEQFLYD